MLFNFNQGEQAATDLHGNESASTSVTQGGITVSMTASADGTDATDLFNVTSTSFGINADGPGDDTDQIDGVNGAESMTFTFSKSGEITQLDLGSLTGTGLSGEDIGSIAFAINSVNNQQFNGGTMSDGSQDTWDVNFAFDAGESITLSWVQGNGFYLDGITIAVPEPTALSLLLLGGSIFLRRRK